jgi:hypothetical protein
MMVGQKRTTMTTMMTTTLRARREDEAVVAVLDGLQGYDEPVCMRVFFFWNQRKKGKRKE